MSIPWAWLRRSLSKRWIRPQESSTLTQTRWPNWSSSKADIRKNFEEGRAEKKEAMAKLKEEGLKENPDIPKMTGILEESLRAETGRINKAFDLMVGYQKNLNEAQQKKLGQMISKRVEKWK